MSLIRPAARAALHRWREVIAAAGFAAFGLWLIGLGGLFLVPLGICVVATGAVLGVLGLRRVRFAQAVDAPGVVEVDEGQVGYLGPTFGGYVALRELVEVRLIELQGRRLWRLKQADGQALLIPVAAAGAERLFDAFSALPGMDTQMLVLAAKAMPDDPVIWRRTARLALT